MKKIKENYLSHNEAVIKHFDDTSCRPAKLIINKLPLIKRRHFFKNTYYGVSKYTCINCGWASELIIERINEEN